MPITNPSFIIANASPSLGGVRHPVVDYIFHVDAMALLPRICHHVFIIASYRCSRNSGT